MKGKKDFIASGLVYTVLGFLPTASRFFLFPLFLHYLSPDDFAIISLNTMVASLLVPFMTLGLENGMNKFYFDFVKHPKIQKVFISTLVISIATFTLVFGLVFVAIGPTLFLLFKHHRFSFFPFGFSALLAAMPNGLYNLFLSYLRCKKDLRNYVALNLGLFILSSLGEIIGIMVFKMNVEHLVWIKPVITWTVVLAAGILMLSRTGIHFEKRLLALSMKYCAPLWPHLVFTLVFTYADRLMIEHYMVQLTYLAIYNLTMAISNIIDIFEQALRNATFPNIFKLLKENVYNNVAAVSRIHTINGLILMGIVSGIAVMVPVGCFYFLKVDYRPLIYLVPFALIISVTRFFYIVYAEPLFFFKKVQYVSWSTFLQGASAIIFNFLLIPKFGLMGAIIANIISKVIQVTFIYYTSLTIKIFRYKVGFILSSTFALISILIGVTFICRFSMTNKLIVQLAALAPMVFTSVVFVYFIKKNKISLKQLW